MSKVLHRFTTVNEHILQKISPQFIFNYYYKDEAENEIELIEDLNPQALILEDAESKWDFKYFGLKVHGEIILKNTNLLFGVSGLVNEDAVIGIAVKIDSKKSLQQFVKPIHEIKFSKNQDLFIQFDEHLDKSIFYGSFTLRIIFYVKQASSNASFGKANIPGMILGSIYEQTIDIDGSTSTLPIERINDKTKPLWYVDFNIIDPLTEPFSSDYVCIYFNEAHPGFSYLEKTNSNVGTYLQNEVLASALTLIISKVKSFPAWNDIENGRNFEDGSIAAAIHYFKSTFNWNFESDEKISESIRLYFQGLTQGDFK